MAATHANTILNLLLNETEVIAGTHLYAVLDAARRETIYPAVMDAASDYYCLYRGGRARDLAAVAPYVVTLGHDDPFTTWLLDNGWGDSWGIFVTASASLSDVGKHLRQFLKVYDEEGKGLIFRYYDPRVLRVYLPTCPPADLKLLFGPVQRYAVESEKADAVIKYGFADGSLTQYAEAVGAAPVAAR
jgi:hypothetical protein